MEREGKRVTNSETIALGGIGVALLGVVIASWADTRGGFTDLRSEIRSVRTELKQDIAEVRTELKQDIAEVRTELKQDIADVRTDLRRLDDRLDEVNVRLVAVEAHTGGIARIPTERDVPGVNDFD